MTGLLFTLAFWLVFTGLLAWGQGWLMPAIKHTPDHTPEADRQDKALHWIFGLAWCLPVVFTPTWEAVAIAAMVRFCFFDAILNYAEGTTVFAVGGTSKTDRVLQWLAITLDIPVTVLSGFLRAAVFLLLVGGIVWKLWINN